MAVFTSMTKLEALNEILINSGLLPVNSESAGSPDADKASILLESASRQIQSEGWDYNTDRNLKLVPDATAGHIIVPLDTMGLDTVGTSAYIGITLRDNQVRKTDRYTGEDPTVFTSPLYVDLIHYLDFERIPQSARYYITIKAARRFADSYLTSGTVHGYTAQEEMEALHAMNEAEGAEGKYNMLTTMPYTRRRSLDG